MDELRTKSVVKDILGDDETDSVEGSWILNEVITKYWVDKDLVYGFQSFVDGWWKEGLRGGKGRKVEIMK